MFKHDNLKWRISFTLRLLCTNGVFVFGLKPDIYEALDDIVGYDLTSEQIHKYHIWPQGIIPYYIDDFSYDKVLRDRIRYNIDQIGKVTGLHFMEIPQPPKDDQNRWVFFLNRKARLGCNDVSYSNFTSEGVQKVVLGYDCIKPEVIAEIILSLVGVAPQHNSPDRDKYITVNLKNILPDKRYLFEKLRPEDWMFNKVEYDFASAGHYNTHKFTINGAETITLKNRENNIEAGKGLSAIDIKKIRTIYNYISYKGKKHVKVPECDQLFVPGSNFSKYKPLTKSKNRLKLIITPSNTDDLSLEKNNISKEVNSIESNKHKKLDKEDKDSDNHEKDEKLKDSEEKIEGKNKEDEGDNKDEIKEDKDSDNNEKDEKLKDSEEKIEGKNREDEGDNKDVIKEDKDSDNNEKDEKLKDSEEKIEGKNKEDEGDNKDEITNKDSEKLNHENNDTKSESGQKTDNENQQQTDSPDSHKEFTLEEETLSAKKFTLLTFIKNNTRSKKKRLKNILTKSDYETGDEGNNIYINEKLEVHIP